MHKMDADRDGFVNLADFVTFHCGGGDTEAVLQEAFRLYDAWELHHRQRCCRPWHFLQPTLHR
ncbi:unnamed protein product [Urochloa humidicola]